MFLSGQMVLPVVSLVAAVGVLGTATLGFTAGVVLCPSNAVATVAVVIAAFWD